MKTKKGMGVGKKRGRKWRLTALQGSGAKSGHPNCLEGSPRQAGLPAIKERTGGLSEDLLGPAVPLSSEGIKNKLLRAST